MAASEPRLSLPVAIADLRAERYGVWPFGIHGGGHPEGHGGFDLELSPGAPVRAPIDGTIERREDNGTFPGQQDLALAADGGGRYVQIGHLQAIPDSVVPGARVVRGELLGHAGAVNGGEFHMIHFAVRVEGSTEPYGEECPLGLLCEADASALAAFYAALPAARKDAFEPALCNPRRLRAPDAAVGVWFATGREGGGEELPRVLTLTAFAESAGSLRALAMGERRMSDLGAWRRRTDGSLAVEIAGWPLLIATLDGDRLTVAAESGGKPAAYERDAYDRLH